MSEPAFEIVGEPRAGGPFVFTCEHASNALHGRVASDEDQRMLQDHWGWDIGAAALTRALCARTRSAGVLSHFSRLLCDPNRPTTSPTYIVTVADGHALTFNRSLDDDEVRRRTSELYDAYHDAIARTVRTRRTAPDEVRLVSIHSFTPTWEGETRTMDVGVLFDDHEAEAHDLAAAIERTGLRVALNSPYSGRGGLMFAVQLHGRSHGLHHVELEVRNDLLRTPAAIGRIADQLSTALEAFRAPNA